jgi:hypothetical protein
MHNEIPHLDPNLYQFKKNLNFKFQVRLTKLSTSNPTTTYIKTKIKKTVKEINTDFDTEVENILKNSSKSKTTTGVSQPSRHSL